jgi:major vault protein
MGVYKMTDDNQHRGSSNNMRETELVLPPGQFAYVLDETKGDVSVYCGPTKASLSTTDSPVLFESATGRFTKCDINSAQQINITAKQGEYIILRNTARDGKRPDSGKSERAPADLLNVGQTENIPGPVSFPLWPTQTSAVVEGHRLRSNQYLVIRVYDEEAAKANLENAVVKEATSSQSDDADEVAPTIKKEQLVTGRLTIVKGTNVSFYIPPTGIEVVTDENDSYVRDAVTLERLEYCMLLDENGEKDYRRGPDVVFPKPTESFVTSDTSGKVKRKFRAYELNDNSGLYIKVIADYEEDGKLFKQGDELFLTGEDTAIYFPRPEHAIIKYGDQEKHYAIAIPKGEARYVLSRKEGDVKLISGPIMFLADPREHVSVRRVLDDKTCELYYPGNRLVLEHNRTLRNAQTDSITGYVEEETLGLTAATMASNLDDGAGTSMTRGFTKTKKQLTGNATFGDELTRGTSFTPPRSITLDTKFDGAVTVNVYTGYAIQVVNKSGERRVVQGPQTVLLQYDEYLERLSLSKGTPKNRDNTLDTVYLRVTSNPVSDIITVKTKDLVDVTIQLKYLVRFVDDENQWFNVDNYVQYMCDHMRSLIGNHVRQYDVQEFHASAADFLRDWALGTKTEDEARINRKFNENDMEVYDLEIINVNIDDYDISDLLEQASQEGLKNTIRLNTEQRNAVLISGQEIARREALTSREETTKLVASTVLADVEREGRRALALVQITNNSNKEREDGELEAQTIRDKVSSLRRDAKGKDMEQDAKYADKTIKREIDQLVAQANADEKRAQAVTPGLVEALGGLVKTGAFKEVAQHLAPLSVVRGESIEQTLKTLLAGTGFENILDNAGNLGAGKFLGKTGTDNVNGVSIK